MRHYLFLFFLLFAMCFLWSCHSKQSSDVIHNNEKQIALADSLNHFDPKAAEVIYRSMLTDSGTENSKNYIKALLGLASVYSNRGVFDTASTLINKASEHATIAKDTTQMLSCLISLGNLNLDLGDMENARLIFNKGLELAKKNNNSEYQHRFLLNLGLVEDESGNYTAAIKTFMEGLKVDEKMGNKDNQAQTLQNLAMAFKHTGEFHDALKYMKQALHIIKTLNQTREYATGLQNLGIIYRNLDENDSALSVYHKSYNILISLNDSLNIMMVRYNIGIILKTQKKYAEAEAEMNSILQFCRQKYIYDGQAYALSALAGVYEQTNRASQGLSAIDSAIRIAKRHKLTSNLPKLLERRHMILADLNRYSEAYEALQTTNDLSDSLISLDKQKEIELLKTRYETEHNEQENMMLKKNLETQSGRIVLMWIGIILGTLFFIVVIILLVIRQKQTRQQKQLAEEKFMRMELEKEIKEKERSDNLQIQELKANKNKELESYLNIISHDLRSPVVNLQGFVERLEKNTATLKILLADCTFEPEKKQSIDKITLEIVPNTLKFISEVVFKMGTLLSGLSQISKTGRITLSITKVNMQQLFETIIAAHSFQISEFAAEVNLSKIPDCYGDANQLNQLFSNIIFNAIKYRDKSRQLIIDISAQTLHNKVIYSIKDTGIGIAPQNLEKIWNVFYRVDPKSPEAGEGIGLSFVKRITDKHYGRIWAESEEGKGSAFFVELNLEEFSE